MLSRFFSATARRATIAFVLLLSISVAIPAFAQGNSAGNTNRPDRVSQHLLELHANGGVVAPVVEAAPTSVAATVESASAQGVSVPAATAETLANASTDSLNALGSLVVVNDGYVLVDASTDGSAEALLADLQAMGLQNGSFFGSMVSGWLPVDAIPQMADVATLSYVSASMPELHEGLVDNEAVFGQATDIAESLYGLTGEGLSIGILSDSFDCQQPSVVGGAPGPDLNNDGISSYADDILSEDLPAGIVVLQDYFVPGCIDEGRAMAQLVHDIIPDAQILFSSAFVGGQAGFANGIINLANAGADVIVDDVRYFAEPVYQDGIIAQAVDIVTAAGIPYFSSAGNAADQGYVAPFNSSGIPFNDGTGIDWILHDFDPGPGVDIANDVSVLGGSPVFILQWDDPFASISAPGVGADTDLDFLVFSPDFSAYYGCSCIDSIGGDPFDGFGFFGISELAVVIGLRAGTNPDATITTYVSSTATDQEYYGDPTNWGHSNAAGANATGAAFWGTTPFYSGEAPLINGFSSYGGLPILFDTAGTRLAEPDFEGRGVQFTGIDGSNNTFFRFDTARDEDTNPNFFGTSAGAPNAAAIAVQMLEANPNLTPLEVRANLQATAIDITGSNDVSGTANSRETTLPVGFDQVSGAGLVQANEAARVSISSSEFTCNGLAATVYVVDGVIVGGPDNGQPFLGVLNGGNGADVIAGTNVTDTINGGNGADVICSFGAEDNVFGGNGDDVVFGGASNDVLRGDRGDDQLFGEGGSNALYGGNGDDTLDGGTFCDGGSGNNTLANCN